MKLSVKPFKSSLSQKKWGLANFSTIISFKLTDIGEGIRDVQLIQWFVREGQHVMEWDKVAEVQSDKATVDITSRYEGVVKKLHYQPSDRILVGNPLMDIEVTEENKK